MILVACALGFPQADLLKQMDVDRLVAFHLLCSKTYNNDQYGSFVHRVDNLEARWVICFGDEAPVCAHIMARHWKVWLRLVKSHSVRTEGGELLNQIHLDAFVDATSKWSPTVRQIAVQARSKEFSAEKVKNWRQSNGFASCVEVLDGVDGMGLLGISRDTLMSILPDAGVARELYRVLHVPHDGCSHLLCVDVGPWWVAERRLNGGFPNWR